MPRTIDLPLRVDGSVRLRRTGRMLCTIRHSVSTAWQRYRAATPHRAHAMRPYCLFIPNKRWLCLFRLPVVSLRTGQAEVFAQGGAGVVVVEKRAALEFRHNETNEVFVGAGQVRGGEHEA